MTIKKDIILLFAISFVFFSLSYFRFFSEFDGLIWIIGTSLLIRKDYYPCLLLLIAGLQDAPGFSYLASYISFTFICWLMIGKEILIWFLTQNKEIKVNKHFSAFKKFVLFATLVSIYGLVISFAQNYFKLNLQAEGRFYGYVFFLMITMIFAGYLSTKILFKNPRLLKLLGFISFISIIHILFVGVIQINFGAESYRSEAMIPSILEKKQLFNVTALNIPRINGPYLSPNAMGMSILLFSILVFINVFNNKKIAIVIFMFFGFLGALLSLSKAVLGYYFLCLAVMLIYQFKNIFLRMFAFSLITIVGVTSILSVLFTSNTLQNSFRIKEGGLGTRDDVWQSVLEGLSLFDWIFGIGLSAWPVFFNEKLGYTLSDPHTYILSVPGTFGLIGIFFYIYLFKSLYFKTFFLKNSALTKILGLVLILLFFGRDIASIPSILGNTQTNFVVWLLLGSFYYLTKEDLASNQQST